MGDFNAKVGNQGDGNVVGNHGLGEKNERGYRLVEWAKEQEMIVGNTWFQQHIRRLWTWKSPDNRTRNQIHYILINRRFRNALKVAKTVPNADCYSDHRLLTGTLRIKLKKVKYIAGSTKYDLCALRNDQEIQNKFNIEVQNRFDVLSDLEILFQDVDDQWEMLKSSISFAAETTIPKLKKMGRRKWMTDEILQLMESRRLNKNNPEKYDR